jgi:hypothetical protein
MKRRWFPARSPMRLGAGKAIISTPYWHAIELLDDRRRRAGPFRKSRRDRAKNNRTSGYSRDPPRHAEARLSVRAGDDLEKSGARLYGKFFAGAQRPHGKSSVQFSARAIPKDLNRLPDLKLDHINALTDDTGVLQHAIFTVPNRGEGHTTDDNARASFSR